MAYFHKLPEKEFVDQAVNHPYLFLISKQSHLASITPKPEITYAYYPNPLEFVVLRITLQHKVDTFFSSYGKIQHFWTSLVIRTEVVNIHE